MRKQYVCLVDSTASDISEDFRDAHKTIMSLSQSKCGREYMFAATEFEWR